MESKRNISSIPEKKYNYYFWVKIDGLKTRIAMDSKVKSWILACALSVIAEDHIMKWTLSNFKVDSIDDYYQLKQRKTHEEIKNFLKKNKSKDLRRRFKSSYNVKDRKKSMDIIINYEKYPLLYLTEKDIYELSGIYFLVNNKKQLSKIFGNPTIKIMTKFINFKVTQEQVDYCKKCTCIEPLELMCEELLNGECNCEKCNTKVKLFNRTSINKDNIYFCGIIDSMYAKIKSLNYDFLVRMIDSVKPQYYRHHFIDNETGEIWGYNQLVPYYNNQDHDNSMYFEVKAFNPIC